MRKKSYQRKHGYTALATEVRPSPIDKLGLFATVNIPRGKVVVVWGGQILTTAEVNKLPKNLRTNYALPIYPGFYIAETRAKDLDSSDFVNHSCDPNCKIANLLIMITKRPIAPDEELTADFDFGPRFGVKTKCNCGSKNCRKVVYF